MNTHFDTSTTQLLKALWERKKLLVTSNFFLSHNIFSPIVIVPHFSIFLTSYFYLLLNWKSPKLTYELRVKTSYSIFVDIHFRQLKTIVVRKRRQDFQLQFMCMYFRGRESVFETDRKDVLPCGKEATLATCTYITCVFRGKLFV